MSTGRNLSLNAYDSCETVPLLELIPAWDPFKPKQNWRELRDRFPVPVPAVVIVDAAHALFPEQPQAVGDGILL